MVQKIIWTPADDILIQELKKKGVPLVEIAEKVNHTQDAIRNRLYLLRKYSDNAKETLRQSWIDGARIAFLDIETSDFNADTGFMLTWCLKRYGGEVISDSIKKNEIFNGKLDKRILEHLIKELKQTDIIITYYGTGFDICFLRTRASEFGIDYFNYGDLYHWDLYYLVKHKLKLHRNSLDAATHFYDIEGKSHVDLKIWNEAKRGNSTAIEQVLEHNKFDVIILEELWHKINKFKKWTKKSI